MFEILYGLNLNSDTYDYIAEKTRIMNNVKLSKKNILNRRDIWQNGPHRKEMPFLQNRLTASIVVKRDMAKCKGTRKPISSFSYGLQAHEDSPCPKTICIVDNGSATSAGRSRKTRIRPWEMKRNLENPFMLTDFFDIGLCL